MTDTTEIARMFPSLCCYCGAPAVQTLDLDARKQQERYGYKWTATIRFGNLFRVPYCAKHYPIALAVQRKLARLRKVEFDADWIPIVLGIVGGVGLMWKSTGGNLCVALPVGVFAGVFLAGALLFLFEALFPYLTGVLFPVFLEPEVRADLARHTKAQRESYPWRTRWITYCLGLSIKYKVTRHAGKWNAFESICATDAEFALRTGGIQYIQDSRMPEEARTEKYQKLSIEDILTTAFPKEISRYEMSNYLRSTDRGLWEWLLMENPEIWEQLVKQVEMRESQRQDAETGLDLAGSILGEEDNVMDKISCPQCSTALDASKNFCTQCGARLRPSTHSPLCQYGQNNSVSKTVRNGCLWATHDALGCLALKKCTQCGHDVGAGLRSCPHCKYTTFEILSEHFSAQAEAASLVNKGVQLWTSGKEDAAIRETARALQTNPWNASTHGNLGVFLYERGQYEQSAVLLERALLLDPDLEGAHDFLQKAIDASKRQDKRYAFIGLFFFMTQEAAARAIEAIPAWLASCFTEKPFVKRWIDNMTGQGFLPVFRDAVPALIRTCVGRTSLQLAVAASFAQIWYLILLMRSADSCLEVMSVLGQKECANCHLAVEEQYIQCPHCSCDQFIPGHLVGQQLLADLEPFTVREGGVYSVLAKGT